MTDVFKTAVIAAVLVFAVRRFAPSIPVVGPVVAPFVG